jgi:hypothetical protein
MVCFENVLIVVFFSRLQKYHLLTAGGREKRKENTAEN